MSAACDTQTRRCRVNDFSTEASISRSDVRRQKKLARKRQQRDARRHELRRLDAGGMAAQFRRFSHGPVLAGFIGNSIQTDGIGSAVLARQAGPGQVALAVFLVDSYCLGVKDAVCKLGSIDQLRDAEERLRRGGARDVSPATLRRLVEDAVAYARNLGFAPHPDYRTTSQIFGDLDPALATETFEFGKDGKPLYISGPNDSPAFARRVVDTLHARCGPDGADFLVGIGDGPELGAPHWDELDFESDDVEPGALELEETDSEQR